MVELMRNYVTNYVASAANGNFAQQQKKWLTMTQWLVVSLDQGPVAEWSLGAQMHSITSITLLSPLCFCASPKTQINDGVEDTKIELNKTLLFPRKYPLSNLNTPKRDHCLWIFLSLDNQRINIIKTYIIYKCIILNGRIRKFYLLKYKNIF